MRDCDIYVQPSRFEGKPISVEEAKIMRCKIVAANYLSANEQLADGKYGVIAEIDPDSLHEKIKGLVDDSVGRGIPDAPPKKSIGAELIKNLESANFGNEREIEKFYGLL